jgi:4-hydroxy-4-methyl-2-oxoglutarate aldolase
MTTISPPPTTTLADVLLLHGVAGCLTPPLREYAPAVCPLAGRAVTVAMAPGPAPDGGAFEPLYDVLSHRLDGAVLVVGGADEVDGAMWGQILSRAGARVGLAAVLLGGRVRDRVLLAAEGVAVWAVGEHTAGAVGMTHVRAVGVPVTIGGVVVEDGDLIVVDRGGAVRLPAGRSDDLVARARRLAAAEDHVLDDLAGGRPLVEAYGHKRSVQGQIRPGGAELVSGTHVSGTHRGDT